MDSLLSLIKGHPFMALLIAIVGVVLIISAFLIGIILVVFFSFHKFLLIMGGFLILSLLFLFTFNKYKKEKLDLIEKMIKRIKNK